MLLISQIQIVTNYPPVIVTERGVSTVPGVNITLSKGINWLKNQRNAAWGWRDDTHRAVVALYLAHGANFNASDQEEDLTAKQLELQMTTAILR